VLKEVAIVTMGKKKDASLAQQPLIVNEPQGDPDSSLGSPSLDNSEYETPFTSISTTPAVSVRRSGRSTRNSSLGITTAPMSSRKRNKLVVADSDDDDDEMDSDMSADAQLARQLQMEEDEYASTANKRRRIEVQEESDDELYAEHPEEEPQSYTGKGKGRAVDPPSRGRRTSRSRPGRSIAVASDELLEDAGSDEAEYVPEDDGSVNENMVVDPISDSDDDEPLMNIKKRGSTKPSASTPAKGSKGDRGRAKRNKRKVAISTTSRDKFAHIEDKWERKRAMNRERAENNHPKLLTMWDDLAAIPVLDVEKAEQPQSITRRLKPFQLEGLSWMTRQEKTAYKGGLLGDEMGKSSYNGQLRLQLT
jgi:DNA repair protein RAD16